MKYKKINSNNYDIYLVKTDKFKTINVSTVLLSKYDEHDITKEKFISEFLINSNKMAKDEVSMSKKYMELYEPKINISDLFNDVHSKVFTTTFLNEKYTEKEMNKKNIDFYYDVIFKPNIDNNMFETSNFNIIKSKLRSYFKMDEEDSSGMAFYNSMKHISDDIPIKLDTRGNIEDLEKIDNKELLKHYYNKLEKSKFIVFVVGDYNDELINSIKNNLDNKVNNNKYDLKSVFEVSKVKETKEYIENKNFKQSIVYLVYKIIDMTKRERELVLPVMNSILGGSSSKLFNNVREKYSMAYYAYSSIFKYSNILYMYAGISRSNYEKAVNLMKEELDEIKIGNITRDELCNSVSSLESSILKSYDSINSISNELKSNIIYGYPFYEDLLKGFKSVTIDEIVDLSKKIELDFIYLLGGEENESN